MKFPDIFDAIESGNEDCYAHAMYERLNDSDLAWGGFGWEDEAISRGYDIQYPEIRLINPAGLFEVGFSNLKISFKGFHEF